MARFSSTSLFTRLYLTVAIAMVVSGATSVYFIKKHHLQGTIDEYVAFTDKIYADLLQEKKIVPNTKLNDLSSEVIDVEGYLISWKILFKNGPPCNRCEWVARSGEVDVYSNGLEQWFAVYKLPNVNAWLVIYENNLFNFVEEDETAEKSIFSDYSFHDFEEIVQLLAVFLAVAGAIYWPVKVIKRQIERLVKIQHQFGAGDLRARASDTFTNPLDELATSFNSMANSISDTVKENQVFAQAVPHEMRTPLSRIRLAVGLLGQNNPDKQQLELLDNIDTYIDDISVLINQVVSFSKLNAAKDDREVSLYKTIEFSVLIDSRIKSTKCDERLEVIRNFDDSLRITTNPAYLRLLVDNLLKNASTHGKERLVVTLGKVDGHIELSVEDDGDGIPQEYLDTIFIPFSRLDVSRSRKTGGLGLGLAISKAACKRMNSKLTVKNTPAGGAKFTCRFL